MSSYIILTKFGHDSVDSAQSFSELEEKVSERIRTECPAVKWKSRFATFGRYDMVDVVECEDPAQVARVTLIIRTMARAVTETMQASDWHDFVRHV